MKGVEGFRFLRKQFRPYRRELIRIVIWSTLESAPTFVSGLVVAGAIDNGFLAGKPMWGVGLLALLGVLWLGSALATRALYPWLARTIEPMRDALVSAVVAATLRRAVLTEQSARGASVSQATEQVEAVRELLSTLLRNLRQVVASGIAALTGLIVLSPTIAIVILGFVTLAMIGFVLLQRLLLIRYRRVVLGGEHIGETAAPIISGIRDVVANAAEDRAALDVGESIDSQAEALRAFAKARVLRLPVLTLGVHLPLLALLALSPWLIASQQLTAGAIAGGVLYLTGGLQQAMQFLVNAGSTLLVSLGVVLDRLAEVCAAAPRSEWKSGRRPAGYRVELRKVTFGYSEHADPVIRELSLDVPEGRHLAVVGPSGVGKSTVTNLLARINIPQRGEILIGGIPIEELDEHWLRRRVALIPQDAYIFVGTVRENLSYLRPGVTDDAIDAAVTAIGADALVARLGGYSARISAGGDALSPAERQLIALVRVFLSPAKIVLLDEATCHLDPAAEATAEIAFAQRGGTLIVIAHRISSARRAKQVLVMDGENTQLGNHGELIASNELYAELVGNWRGTSEPVG